MLYTAYTIHVVISLFLILVVLLQQGKGADLSVFGGGGTQAAFGARGAATLLHKMTVWGFVAFILTTMAIGFLQTQRNEASVMSGVPTDATTVEGVVEAPSTSAVDQAPSTIDSQIEDTAETPDDDGGRPPPPGE